MEYKLEHEMCLLCGDIHGCLRDDREYTGFFDSVDKCGGFQNCDIIILGDIGVGFYYFDYKDYEYKSNKDHVWLKELDTWAKENNNDVWVFRGNHDDPAKFEEGCKLWSLFDKIHCLRDGDTVISHNGRRYLIVGGSVSIDRSIRELGYNYWHNEYMKMDIYEKMDEQTFDGIFAHTGPTPPQCQKSLFVENWAKREDVYVENYGRCNNQDKPLMEVIKEERDNVDKLIDKFKPTRWFNGHYHEDAHFEHNGCEVFALGISKFLELDKYE